MLANGIYKTTCIALALLFLPACKEEVTLSCRDECYAGERHCLDENSYLMCDNYDQDICLEWPEKADACPSGSICHEGYCIDAQERCNRGDTRCDTELNGYQVCEYVDKVLKWGRVTPCEAGTYCRSGSCSKCKDACLADIKRCSFTTNGVETCLLNKESGCLEWQLSQPCVGNTVCNGGSCTLPDKCYDECFEGQIICEGDGYRSCGQYDTDSCLEFGPVIECDFGLFCSNGACSRECVNECSQEGIRECFNVGFRICTNVDSDPCLDWSYNPCPLDESCSLGKCAPLDSCTDECDGKTCLPDGLNYRECGQYDSDKCLDLGPAVACDANLECLGGSCYCSCDYASGVCEPKEFQSAESCPCDEDCKTNKICAADDYCDSWCVPGNDPDCSDECECDVTLFCDAGCNFNSSPGCPVLSSSTINCYCDPECFPNKSACVRDGYYDDWCPSSGPWADPDADNESCAEYTMAGGYYYGDSPDLKISGDVELPDNAEGEGWILLGPTILTSGALEATYKISNDIYDCVAGLEFSVYGYDSCYGFGSEGAQIYFYNWQTSTYDLQSGGITNTKEWTYYNTTKLNSYLKCGMLYCSFQIKISTDNWQCSHINILKYNVNMKAKDK